jgi:hypothetical protein
MQQRAVLEGVDIVREGIREGKDLAELFQRELLPYLASLRQQCAMEAGTREAAIFGTRRDLEALHATFYTPIAADIYQDYVPNVLRLALSHFKDRNPEPGRSGDPYVETHAFVYSGLSQIKRLYRQVARAVQNRELLTFSEQKEKAKIWGFASGIRNLSSGECPLDISKVFYLCIAMDLRQGDKEIPLSSFAIAIPAEGVVSRKSVDTNEEVKGDMTPLLSYLEERIALLEDIHLANQGPDFISHHEDSDTSGRLEDLCPKSPPASVRTREAILLHQSGIYHKEMSAELARLFKLAIEVRPEEGIAKLQERVAECVYFSDQASFFCRGSSAITQWIEMLIYYHHGLACVYPLNRLICLEAITSRWQEFRMHYPELVCLIRLDGV